MKDVCVKDIIEAVNGKLVRGNLTDEAREFFIDSRSMPQGGIFVAIKGNNFDGHDFVSDVIKKGVRGIIVKDSFSLPDVLPEIVIRTGDTIRALGDIAKIFRNKFNGLVISVTGTVGKTTTKEFIASVLEGKFRVHKTLGTLNNHIGVPLTLWGLADDYSVAVVELGMSGLGEIKYLSDIAKPDIGVITHIGPAHLEQLGSVENVLKAKAELLESMGENGLVVINRDTQYFSELRAMAKCRVITVGRHHEADFQAVDIEADDCGRMNFKVLAKPVNDILEIKLPVIGIHTVYPAMIAVSIGYCVGMDPSKIINSFSNIKLPKMRLEVKDIAGIRIIDDCYNANPLSMSSALETLSMIKNKGKKIFVCGDMLELGIYSQKYHRELGLEITKFPVDRLITVGNLSGLVSDSAVENGMSQEKVKHCKNNVKVVEALGQWLEPGDIVLVKGSRGNYMEEISKGMEEYYNQLEKLIV